jgi:hypothetical protein
MEMIKQIQTEKLKTMKRWPEKITKCFLLKTIPLALIMSSCSLSEYTGPDQIAGPNQPIVQSTAGYDHFLFCYKKENPFFFQTRPLGSTLGTADIYSGNYLDYWDHMTAVQVGTRQFIAGHDGLGTYFIRSFQGDGKIGRETDRGEWNNSYLTFMGFHVGDRGFVFGQNSYTNYWFVQEVTSSGKYANETDNGHWHNYYNYMVPIYINGKTYLFFQTEESNGYWFISYVSPDGRLSDICDGYWSTPYYPYIASVEIGGYAYLIYTGIGSSGVYEYLIRRIDSDGKMGAETDHGTWSYPGSILTGYTTNGHAYLCGELPSRSCFIREITADGKMGTETSRGTLSVLGQFIIPFTSYDLGNFRYEIGWDMSKATGMPANPWSSLFIQPWSIETKSGGGAALDHIDQDAGQLYDAVFTGIQWLPEGDRFYYKVAWNLDNTGKAASWSKTFYGPSCGTAQSGGGADIADIDGNGIPDLLVMSVDNPEKSNSFWYYIGWNMGTGGQVTSWSPKIQVNGLGWDNSGGGAALGDIDKNGLQDVVLMGIDNTSTNNSFWYTIGRNLNQSGVAVSWSPMITAPPNLGWDTAGGGAALADVNGNGKADLILTGIDSPKGANPFWCYIGWDIDINGNVTGWSAKFIGPSPGNITCGGGTAVADINKNGIPDLLLMSVDDPYGND